MIEQQIKSAIRRIISDTDNFDSVEITYKTRAGVEKTMNALVAKEGIRNNFNGSLSVSYFNEIWIENDSVAGMTTVDNGDKVLVKMRPDGQATWGTVNKVHSDSNKYLWHLEVK